MVMNTTLSASPAKGSVKGKILIDKNLQQAEQKIQC
jgi:hypothetical protein